jgi:hypothetical protein
MTSQMPATRPVKTIISCFLGLSAVAMAVAAAGRAGMITSTAEKRALGLIVGIMAVAVGNFLPKVRPLQRASANAAQAMAVERFAGWTLVLVGIVYVALFVFLPLDLARPVSALVGIGGILIGTVGCIWLAPSVVQRRQPAETSAAIGEHSTAKRGLMRALLFAFLSVFLTACAAALFSRESWWMTTGFLFSYATMVGFRKRSACNCVAAE